MCITGAGPAGELEPLTATLHGAGWASPPGPPKAEMVNKLKSCCQWKLSEVVAEFCASVSTWNILIHFRMRSYFTISYVVNTWQWDWMTGHRSHCERRCYETVQIQVQGQGPRPQDAGGPKSSGRNPGLSQVGRHTCVGIEETPSDSHFSRTTLTLAR